MPRTVVAPPANNVYVAMLGLAVFHIALGCALLGLELSGYDTAAGQKVDSYTPPKVEPRPTAAPAGGTTPAPGGTAKVTPPPAEPPAPVAPLPIPTLPPAPAVAAAPPAPKVEPPKVEDPSKRGPRPGTNVITPPQRP